MGHAGDCHQRGVAIMPLKDAKTFLKVDVIAKKLPSDRRSKEMRMSDLRVRSLMDEIENDLRKLHDRIGQIEETLKKIPGA
jgi:hypothetical protein